MTTLSTPSTINPNQALWEKGDFTRIAQTMRRSGENLVNQLGIAKNDYVLDLGCGDGTTAIPAARLGATVIGIDIARNLVEAGNMRAKEEGLSTISFHHGNANKLDMADKSVDKVISIFGAMFAPNPNEVAKEMVRVTKPGGKIVMGNWIPGDPTLVAQILRISSAYTPPPPADFVSPMLWGVQDRVMERFALAGIPPENISFIRDTYVFEFSGTPHEFVHLFKTYYGPTMNAFDAAEKNNKAVELQHELEVLFTNQNISAATNRTIIPATFLRVRVDVPNSLTKDPII